MITVDNLKLWPHQKEAITMASQYLESPSTGKSFLLKLPTGSGKTGIFATLTRITHPDSNTLIVVPSIALRHQIYEEITSRFWNTINLATEIPNKFVSELLPSSFNFVKENIDDKPFILICVVNTLHIIKELHPVNYQYLKSKLDFIIFDEGHKEPAYSWAKAVRELEKKILLFTATPFRNDVRLFNIDKNKFFSLYHLDAINLNIIRDIEIKQINLDKNNLLTSIKSLISKIEIEKKKYLNKPDSIIAKTIIRCKDETTIRQVVLCLKKMNQKVIGIHETFGNQSDLLKEVPDKSYFENVDFVVHQNKLIEGIDYPNFLILVLMDDFSNERSLIQQIGRITRNTTQQPSHKSIVFTNTEIQIKNAWDKYLSYDNNINEYGKLYDISNVYNIDPSINWLYFNGNFRKIVSLEEIDKDSIILPKRTSIRINIHKYKFTEIIANILEDNEKYDIQIIDSIHLDKNGYLILYELFKNSQYLAEELYIENKFGVTIFYLLEDHLFYYSTDNLVSEFVQNNFQIISQAKLENILNRKKRYTRISHLNSDVGSYNIRSRNLSAYSLENSPTSLNDHNFVTSFVEAIVEDENNTLTRRYTGMANSKVSDYGLNINIKQYYKWIKGILKLVKDSANSSTLYFKRFAKEIGVPLDTTPINILIDLTMQDISPFKANGVSDFIFNDLSSNIAGNEFSVSLKVNNIEQQFKCYITYNGKANKYKILCTELSSFIYDPYTFEDIVHFVNKHQLFRIITFDCIAFYSFGRFYSPKLNLNSKNNDLDLLKLFIPIVDLANISSEKGNNTSLKPLKTLWHKDTLFGMIARMGMGYKDEKILKSFLKFEYLVCDDLNKENADFIALDKSNKKIVLIHAKSKNSILSASSFQDICGQTVKNLDYLSPFYEKKPESNFKKWDGNWSKKDIGTVDKRMIKGGLSGKQFWSLYEELVRDPDTKKSVYLITGSMFSLAELNAELNKTSIKKVKPEVIQLVYIIRSTWSSVSSYGADLKIFCY